MRHGTRSVPKLAPWCTGGPPASPTVESEKKTTGTGGKRANVQNKSRYKPRWYIELLPGGAILDSAGAVQHGKNNRVPG